MHILVLGASSHVGSALARAFASGHALILVGRNAGRLNMAAGACQAAGAVQVSVVEVDFSLGITPLLQALEGKHIDLIIDAASACSSKRDSEIEAKDIRHLISADFVSRTELFDRVLAGQVSPPAVIYISTVLTLVKSPGRTVYTALKGLYETYLLKLKESRPGLYLLVVYVGTVIETRRASEKPQKLASAVVKAFQGKKDKLLFGLSGRFYLGLFYLQPVIFSWFTLAQRKARQLLAPQS